jgi:hypothetical protein
MSFLELYEVKLYEEVELYQYESPIYNILYDSMNNDDALYEILRKSFWLEMNNDYKETDRFLKIQKTKLAQEIEQYKSRTPENFEKYETQIKPYIDFMKKQKDLFGSDNFYNFTFNKSTKGFQVDIKRPKGTSTRTDILSDSAKDLETSSCFCPILSITPDNYIDVITQLYDAEVLHDKEKLFKNIETHIVEKGPKKGFEEAYRQIKLAYIARINEYKVHLQVKPEYQFWVLQILNNLIRSSENFKACVEGIKMHNFYDVVNDPEKNVPSIVIYLSGNNLKQTDQEKKTCAKTVVNILINTFKEYSAEIGLNKTPRYNRRVNELIYWSNGPGDVKVKMEREGILDVYFSKESNYSCLNPIDCHDFSIEFD